jgi:hypothetical protein
MMIAIRKLNDFSFVLSVFLYSVNNNTRQKFGIMSIFLNMCILDFFLNLLF